MVTMAYNPNPLFRKAQLTILNFNNFKIAEAMGLKLITSRSPLMASPPYHMSLKST
jgi:hypothetical protein